MPGLYGLDVAAADIDMEVAELSVTGILRFAQWSQGNGELESALSCIAELFWSRKVLPRIGVAE